MWCRPVGPDERHFRMSMVHLLYRDGRPGSEFALVHAIAWNDQAEHLAKYNAGDEIQFVGRLNAARNRDRPGYENMAELSFTIMKIDDSRTLVSATEKFLNEFMFPHLSLSDQINQATVQKEHNEAAGRDPAKTIQP